MKVLLAVLATVFLFSSAHADDGRDASVSIHPCQTNEVAIVGVPSMTSEGNFRIPVQCEPAVCYILKTGGLLTTVEFSVIRKENQRISTFESAPSDSSFQKSLTGFQREWRTLATNLSTELQAANAAQVAIQGGQCSSFGGDANLHSNF